MKSSELWGDHVFILFGFEDVCMCVCVCVWQAYVWNVLIFAFKFRRIKNLRNRFGG